MDIGAMFRRAGFWGVDRAQGGAVGRHIDDIKSAFRDPEQAMQRSEQRARELLSHAMNTTDHYAQYLGATSIGELPILKKRTVREHYDKMLSTAYDPATLPSHSTSGSYGIPLTFRFSREKRNRQRAEIIYFGGWAGYHVGDPHVYLTAVTVKSWLQRALQNQVIMDPTRIDDAWLEEKRQILRQGRFRTIVSYPSSISAIVDYCRACGDGPADFAIGAVITSGESLTQSIRKGVGEVLGCPALSRYAAMEFGVLAHECMERQNHHLNIASYITEIVALHEDRPAEPGEVGRVIVTDVFSHAMPLIRYETGDLAQASETCGCPIQGPVLSTLVGRECETLVSADGRLVSPRAISATVRQVTGILQYQLTQETERSYRIKLVPDGTFDGKVALTRRIKELLGAEASVEVICVSEIPPLASGKRPYIISAQQRDRYASE